MHRFVVIAYSGDAERRFQRAWSLIPTKPVTHRRDAIGAMAGLTALLICGTPGLTDHLWHMANVVVMIEESRMLVPVGDTID